MNDKEILEDFIEGKIEPDKLENYKGGYKMGFFYTKDLQKAIENLIQRNKDLEQIEKEHKEENGRLRKEIYKKDKIIDLMAEQLTTPVHSKKWVIEYFTNKVEEDK